MRRNKKAAALAEMMDDASPRPDGLTAQEHALAAFMMAASRAWGRLLTEAASELGEQYGVDSEIVAGAMLDVAIVTEARRRGLQPVARYLEQASAALRDQAAIDAQSRH